MDPFAPLRRRREARARAVEELRRSHAFLREDLLTFGEQLADLHLETLTTQLDEDGVAYYRHALDAYERAKEAHRTADDADGLDLVARALVDGRYARACVLALADGEPLPLRLPECFFDPRHGPSVREVDWAPPQGAGRRVPVCAADLARMGKDEAPAARLVRVGDRHVPLHTVLGGGVPAHVAVRTAVDTGVHGARMAGVRHGAAPGGPIDAAGFGGP